MWRGDGQRRSVALTFDDGPSESTPLLLEELSRFGIHATFFPIGTNVRRLPETARLVAAAGHEFGNHTETHPRLWLQSPHVIASEVDRAQETLAAICAVKPRWFRATYGVRWPGLRAALGRHGMTNVMWGVIGSDWRLSAAEVAAKVVRGVRPGTIICLHDGRELRENPDIRATIEAVRRIVPDLLQQGFRFETVGELLCPTTTSPGV